ncbi:hypothetical protein D918_10165 [Trichuris suis]|nr:hypothetical protein D918_10165 [Trichuris suis]
MQTPVGMSPRMVRWSILLSAYDYDLVYRPGKEISNADALSRIPQAVELADDSQPLEVLMLESMHNPPITAHVIAQETSRDPVLDRVKKWTQKGWPRNSVPEAFKPFGPHRSELSVHKDCVLRDSRVVIPLSLRTQVLQLLHAGHPGIVRMKSLARSYVWWPGLDRDVGKTVLSCLQCQENRHNPPRENEHRWPEARTPWSRIHVVFFGPFQGKMFMIVVDAFSKWVEHLTTAPFHPASNGQAERLVQSTKEALRKESAKEWNVRLARLLLAQHSTPSSATGKSPAELLLNRRLVTLLDKLRPEEAHADVVEHRKRRAFETDDLVFARCFQQSKKWIPAVVVSRLGQLMYVVRTSQGQVWKRHVDQLFSRQPNAVAQ